MTETRLSSPLPSLTPSPEHQSVGERPQKRPRLASPSPPSPADFVPRSSPGPRTAPSLAQDDQARSMERRVGAEEAVVMEDVSLRGGDDHDGTTSREPGPVLGQQQDPALPEPITAQLAEEAAGKAEEDDSGVAFLPDDDATEKLQAETVEVEVEAAEVEVEADMMEEELDFDGDDIWLGFDETDVGFDQPQTFPSSALAPPLAPLSARAPAFLARVSSTRNALHTPRDAALSDFDAPAEPRLQDFGFANFDPSSGFTFATRKPFAVSEKALQRAKALLDAEDTEEPSVRDSSTRSTGKEVPAEPRAGPSKLPTPMRPHSASDAIRTSTPINTVPTIPASSPLHSPQIPPISQAGPSSSATFMGFQNAAGRSLKMPSEAALQRARNKLEAKSPSPTKGSSTILRPARPRAHSRASPMKDLFAVGAATSTAAAGPPPIFRLKPIAAVRDTSQAMDVPVMSATGAPCSPLPTRLPSENGLDVSDKHEESAPSSSSALGPASTSVVDREEPPSSAIHRQCADLAVVSSPAATTTAVQTSLPIAAETPLRPVARRPQLPSGSRSDKTHPLPPPRPGMFRPPLLAGQPKSTPHIATLSSRGAAQGPASTPLKSFGPITNNGQPEIRRLSFGMTPRAKPFHLANTRTGTPASTNRTGVKAFVTPFKGGKRPEGLTPMGLKDKLASASVKSSIMSTTKTAASSSSKKKATAMSSADLVRREKAKVFDLEAPAGDRYDLTFGMRPQTHYYEHLEDVGLPVEVLSMDSRSGAAYIFPGGRGIDAAFTALQELVAERMPTERELVTMPWVKNHWTLVLWKLASYVRSRPDLLHEWWSFERVMDQLRYRYEREINRAERPAIKRVQEHDSPASLPMVLCVSQIRWEEAPHELDRAEPQEGALVISGLELTDGWYRIRANVDRTLKSACERGKIVVGCKLAVAGAKLDTAGSEGTDVLQALNKSQLVISGNSTSLAPWHAKLGFSRQPFIAGLSSLSPDGGLVPLVDVLVERAFPCGYIDLRKGRGTETWSEEEELTRSEEWKLGRQRIEAKLAEEMEKETTDDDALVELLQEAAERFEQPSKAARESSPSEEPDEILDRLEAATNKHAIIRQLDSGQVQGVLALAQENARSSRFRAVEDLQKELASRYPPREVRRFRVLRIVDAREGTKDPRRSAQLTVWDAQSFERDFFHEGQRYLISNLMPKGNWRTTDREISLATRRDTRWTKI
ncbi:hypothetical protein JCM10908_005389 [Rhodotorula pacifica]|uniref:uncharacterized protein n=1 Tax=Rhodotorula pacifica TaxID=1495444 RepID=UPI003179327F